MNGYLKDMGHFFAHGVTFFAHGPFFCTLLYHSFSCWHGKFVVCSLISVNLWLLNSICLDHKSSSSSLSDKELEEISNMKNIRDVTINDWICETDWENVDDAILHLMIGNKNFNYVLYRITSFKFVILLLLFLIGFTYVYSFHRFFSFYY